MWRLLTISVLMAIFGCSQAPPKFNSHLRHAVVDALWDRFEQDYVYVDFRQDIKSIKAVAHEAVRDTNTRREYVVALAKVLALLNDPHILFRNFGEYWQATEGVHLVPAVESAGLVAGCYWVHLFDNSIIPDSSNEPLPPQQLYQVMSVEHVPMSNLAFSLLWAEPGQVIPIDVLAGDSKVYQLRIRVPL